MSRIPQFNSKLKSGHSQTTDEVPELPIIRKMPPFANRARRSKSLTDLRRPIITSTVQKPQVTSKITASATKSVCKAPVPKPVPRKVGLKRAGESTESEVKSKVVRKTVKIPDWDYKTRFSVLNEKHMTLMNEHKKNEAKLSEFHEITQKNEDLTQEVAVLKQEKFETRLMVNELKTKCEDLQKNLDESKNQQKEAYERITGQEEKINNLEKSNKEKEEELQRANFEKDCTVKEFAILKEKHERVCWEVENLNGLVENLTSEVYKREKMRRVLHNQIQDLKGNIRVFCRIRPPTNQEQYQCNFNIPTDKLLEISKMRGCRSPGGVIKSPDVQEFTFDRVFGQETRQEEVFEELSQLIQSALDGYHVCVFAYGQTGSGKTYTMQGEPDLERQGMIPRSIDLIFQTKAEMEAKGWSYKIHASFLEIYNENIRDLLAIDSGKSLEIRFNEGKGTTVSNLTVMPISTAAELTGYMFEAQENRSTAVTNFNEHSSRSHAVTKIYIEARYKDSSDCYVGSVSLVDLAGSESAKFTTTERLTETKNINKSLSCLGNVMLALYKKESHIPFRNSKLTYLLQSSLGGNCKCLMIVNISPTEDCYGESINALRFASQVKAVKTGTARNKLTRNLCTNQT